MEHFITQIKIEELRHLQNIDIKLNSNKRTNLLLTGKNGAGKTTVLRALKKYLTAIADGKITDVEKNYPKFLNSNQKIMETAELQDERYKAQNSCRYYRDSIKKYKDGIAIHFNETDGLEGLYKEGKFILAFYGADRKTGIIRQTNVEDVVLRTSYSLEDNPGQVLLKYLIHLKTQQAYARNENDIQTVEMLEQWFDRFVQALKILLDNPEIQLKYDYKNYNFEIIEKDRKPFGFDQLSDGYSAAIQIVADLILRMEQNWLKKEN